MRVRHALLGALCSLGLTLAVAAPSVAAPDTTTIVLIQGKPVITQISDQSVGQTGHSFAYDADLSTRSGRHLGVLAGVVLTVDTTLDGIGDETRHRNLIFRLKAGQLVAQGVSFYPAANTQLASQRPVIIAIIGGTGKYIGARGEVTTTRRADGTYRHVITLLR